MSDTANITFDLSPDERDAILDTLIGLRSPRAAEPEPQSKSEAENRLPLWQTVAEGPLRPCCPGWQVMDVDLNYASGARPIALRVSHTPDCPVATALVGVHRLNPGWTLCLAPTKTTGQPCTQHVPQGELCRHHRPAEPTEDPMAGWWATRCGAPTKSSRRCILPAPAEGERCHVHRNTEAAMP